MFGVLKKIFAFAGKRKKLLVKSMIVAFVGAVFSALQVVAMMFSLDYIVSGQISKIWFVLSIMLVSIIGRAACSYYSTNAQTETGYFMVAEKRIHIRVTGSAIFQWAFLQKQLEILLLLLPPH